MIKNIQALRALAAILVVLHHAFSHYIAMGGHFTWIVVIGKLGYTGVDIFFVISGFVVALTTADKPRGLGSARRFIHNRMARIYLGYWPFLVLMFALTVAYAPELLQNFQIPGSILLVVPRSEANVLPVAWSLTYELYFYFLFSLLFWFQIKNRARCVLVFFLFILFRNLFFYLKVYSPGGFLTSHFLLEFCAGALLYYYRIFLLKRYYIVIAVVGFIVGALIGITNNFENGQKRVYSFGVAAFCLVWVFLLLDHHRFFQAKGLVTKLGDASYTIYLSHTLVLALFAFSGLRDFFSLQTPVLTELAFVVLIVSILAFSLYFYNVVEAPLYKRFRKLV